MIITPNELTRKRGNNFTFLTLFVKNITNTLMFDIFSNTNFQVNLHGFANV